MIESLREKWDGLADFEKLVLLAFLAGELALILAGAVVRKR